MVFSVHAEFEATFGLFAIRAESEASFRIFAICIEGCALTFSFSGSASLTRISRRDIISWLGRLQFAGGRYK